MNIYTEILNDIHEARINGRTRSLSVLSLVAGEIQRNQNVIIDDNGNKIYSNDICLSVLKSLQKNWMVTHDALPADDSRRDGIVQDLQIIRPYFPRQLTEDQLREIKFNTDPSHLSHWMKFLKENYSGQYDGAVAKKVFEC